VKRFGEMLDRRGGEYFADRRLTVADLKVFLWVRYLRSGMLDYVPNDIPDRLAPNLVEHFERVNSHPAVVAWYEAH
jgi:glutathione S-transferase